MSQKNKYFIVIDAGTSGVKVGLGTSKGKIVHVVKTEWSYFSPEELDPYGVEFNPEEFWSKIILTIKEAIFESDIDKNLISCIAVTSQRHGCVFIDKNGKELYSAPNRDARGLEVDIDEYINTDELYKITGLNPPFLFIPARYLWFKENDEEKFNQIDKILPIYSWIVYKLTNRSVIDVTTASATQLLDLEKLTWSEKILDSINLPKSKLPDLVEIGSSLGTMTSEVSKLLGLRNNTIVTISGADTQSAVLGTGFNDAGDIVIVAGSTMPIIQLIDTPIRDSEKKLWSGCFLDSKKWLLEANSGPAGIIKEWFVQTFLNQNSGTTTNPYNIMETLATSHKPGSDDITMDLGIQIFDLNNMMDITASTIRFPSVIYSLDSNVNLGSFAHALDENIAFAIRANIEVLTQVSKLPAKNISIVGGLSKSRLLRKMLASVLNMNIKHIHSESTILGSLFACDLAKNYLQTYDEFFHLIKEEIDISEPNVDDIEIYNQYYRKWLENYKQQRKISDEF